MTASPIAIRARGLRKAYRVYHHPLDALIEAIGRKSRYVERVALENVDLELRRGEIVGVLGRNGAGKSTLLKLIAGTLERSSGELEVNGRITAILELGTGFHPDYTGRENIHMGGLCLGMSRREIDAKINAIIDFSELQDVIDQPFKTFSTGMQARLTFSTAISVEPDILIVDEALSVGDARFQLKCFGRLQQLRDKKTTILLVSHDTNTITTLCDHALILEKGSVFAEGDAKKISVLYHNLLFGRGRPSKNDGDECFEDTKFATDKQNEQTSSGGNNGSQLISGNKVNEVPAIEPAAATVRYGTGEAHLIEWGLFDSAGNRISIVESGSAFRLSMILKCTKDISDLSFGFAIKDRRGTVLWGITNMTHQQCADHASAGETLMISADSVMWLAAGDYFVTVGAAHLNDGEKIDFVEDAIGFRVFGPGNIFTTSIVNMQTHLNVTRNVENKATCT